MDDGPKPTHRRDRPMRFGGSANISKNPMIIIAVDWSKDSSKRAAYRAEPANGTVSRVTPCTGLEQLLHYASALEAPALIGIDAAIGFPTSPWNRLVGNAPDRPGSFIDFLLGDGVPPRFFDPVAHPEEWSPSRPFIRPPAGRWSLKAFAEASADGLRRRVDSLLHAQPIFVTSGLPGSVGSGTRAIWQEMIRARGRTQFSVWPFQGRLTDLLNPRIPVIAEIYPKACYGIALADELPAPLVAISKTREAARETALERLSGADWVARHRVALQDLDVARRNEDDFDALLSAAALMRLVLERAPLEGPEWVDSTTEGGVVGAASLDICF